MKKAIANCDGSYITNLKDDKFIIKSDLYVELGNLYRKMDYKDLMCDNYENACELGDCEMFEENCNKTYSCKYLSAIFSKQLRNFVKSITIE